MAETVGKRDFLSILDVRADLKALLDETRRLKEGRRGARAGEALLGKALAMIFEKSSTRTRVSFEVGMTQLGGTTLYLNPQDLQLGRGETVEDTARVLSRYVDAILYRAFDHGTMERLAAAATVPVINGLDDLEHPCQALADLFTIQEALGGPAGRKLAYVGDGNNVCNSLFLASALTGMHMTAACPEGYEPDAGILQRAGEVSAGTGAALEVVTDPGEAVTAADVVYTDVWVSMGMEDKRSEREKTFRPYQVNEALLDRASQDAVVMHCLPAHRGLEITDDVLDGPRSIVWEQAENRLHAQKALLIHLLAG